MVLFRNRSQRAAEAKLDQDVETVSRLLDDPDYQLSLMPRAIVDQARRNGHAGEIPNAAGSFALVPSNPVPVNGTVGAMAWLSRLQTRHGESLVFHRLGILGDLEVYETLSLQRQQWAMFFFDPRYLSASTRAPNGYQLLSSSRPFHGVGSHMRDFPFEFDEIVNGYSEAFKLATVAPNKILNQLPGVNTERPAVQQIKLEWLQYQQSLSANVQDESAEPNVSLV
ncbi:MAG: hypothetical protein AAF499_17875 [Pseudomonadota bacterium]